MGLLALFVSIGIARWQNRTKKLVYEILVNTTLISKTEAMKGKVQIEYDGQYLDSVHLIVIKITNTGKTFIERSDFEGDIYIRFDTNVTILDMYIGKVSPSSLEPNTTYTTHKVAITPLLLNTTDYFVLNILINHSSMPIVEGRIKGIKEIRPRKTEKQSVVTNLMTGLIGAVTVGGIVYVWAGENFYGALLIFLVTFISFVAPILTMYLITLLLIQLRMLFSPVRR